ncbi:helix-turn-helix domain-containing protein [Nocardia arthritidis]|uniref:helix-turn-helix domain-containing protein n=1 Tax=Nocardia arthritidis TaxID=228602 RepID=UPI00142E2369|nr:helix-turn-helix transcriptional regulator [Nocardia arthritidis]
MASREDPDAVAYLVGVELAAYRKRAGRTISEAAKELGCSQAKIHNMENGRNQQRPDEVEQLLTYYGAGRADVDRLCALAGSAVGATWWAPWTDVVPDWLKTFVGLEGLATHEHVYAPQVLPALVQTADYSFAATEGDMRVRPDHYERVAALRQGRQRRITEDDERLVLEVFLEEAALDRPFGGQDVMNDQYRHLLDLSMLENVSLRLLPTSIGRHDAVAGRFVVLQFSEASSIAYIEMLHGAVYVQDPDEVAGYTRVLDKLRACALDPNATAAAIRARIIA